MGNARTHHPGANDADAACRRQSRRARRLGRKPGIETIFLRGVLQEKNVDQIFRHLAARHLAEPRGLKLQRLRERQSRAVLDHIKRRQLGLLGRPVGRRLFPIVGKNILLRNRADRAQRVCRGGRPCPPGLAGNRESQRHHLGPSFQARGRHHFINQPDPQRLRRRQQPRLQNMFRRGVGPDETGQTHTAAPRRNEPVTDLGQSDHRHLRITRDPPVASQGQLVAATRTSPVNRTHHRHLEIGQERKQSLPFPRHPRGRRRVRELREPFEIRPGDKNIFFRTQQHDRLHRLPGQRFNDRPQCDEHDGVDHVRLAFLVIKIDPADTIAVDRVSDWVAHFGKFRSRIR